MNAADVLDKARDAMSVKRVFGEPYERNGVTWCPWPRSPAVGVAVLAVGPRRRRRCGCRVGRRWRVRCSARSLPGVFVITGDDVRWQPAVDVNRIVLGGQIVGIVFLLVLRSILPARR